MPRIAARLQRAKKSVQNDWRALLGRGIDDPDTRRNWRLCLLMQAAWSWFLASSYMSTYYLETIHLSPGQVFWLQVIWAAVFTSGTTFGGWLADRFGVRRIMICGTLLNLAQTMYFSFCRNFWQLAIALTIAGAYGALLGGSTDTLCTASLQKGIVNKAIREGLYKQYQHIAVQVRAFMAPLAILLGNYLWRINVHLPFKVQIAINVIPVVAAVATVEPRLPAPHLTLNTIRKRLRMLLRDRPDIRWATVVFVVSGATSIACWWLIQPLMTDVGVPKSWFGWIYVTQSVCVGVLSWALKPVRNAKPVVMWGFLAAATSLGALGAGLGGITGVATMLIGFSCTRASLVQFLAGYLHQTLGEDAETRSTDISIIDSVQTAVFAVVGIGMSKATDALSTEMTLMSLGGVCLTLNIVALIGLWRASRLQ